MDTVDVNRRPAVSVAAMDAQRRERGCIDALTLPKPDGAVTHRPVAPAR